MKRAIGALLPLTLFVAMTTAAIGTTAANAVTLQDCSTGAQSLAANDDSSTSQVALPFTINFFGSDYDNAYLNNNGNITFTGPLGTFTPNPIGQDLGFPIIAPFWADVDTRGTTPPSALLTYTTTTFGGHIAFCVSWDGVGYFAGHTDKLNNFQVLLVDRSDQGVNDFDIVFNYQQVQWETGDASGGSGGLGGSPARAGYSDGQSSANSSEIPGSGVVGGLLDTNSSTGLIHNNTTGAPAGQYVYPVRSGAPPLPGSISGTVWNDANENGQADSESGEPGVTVCLDEDSNATCGGGGDIVTTTDENGNYSFSDLSPNTYTVQLEVPAGWHNTGANDPNDRYTIGLSAGQASPGNDFFIRQDEEAGPILVLTKTDSPDPVQEQNPITYTLDVTNNGSGDANDIVLTDDIPAGTTFNQASATQGSCSFAAGTVTCNLGTVTGGSIATVTLIVQAPNVTADTVLTNDASVSSSNADGANASADTTVLVNTGGSTEGKVPPDTTVPLTFTTGTQSANGQTAVNAGDKTAVSIIVPPGGPGGNVHLDELLCAVAPCTGAAAAKDVGAQAAAPAVTGKVVLGGVVFSVVPPEDYPNSKPFKVTLLYDKTLGAKLSPVYYFKPGVTPTEITLPHCGTTPPNGGKPCVLKNQKITTGPAIIRGDWRVVVRINSDPRMRK